MRELSHNVLDIVQNSIKAKASLIEVAFEITQSSLTITVKDNGCGMDNKTLKNVENPFMTSRKERGVGMGIPLFKQSALITGGSFNIKSKQNVGTTVTAVYNLNSIDLMPMGDMTQTALQTIITNVQTDFIFKVKTPINQSIVDTREIKKVLDGIDIQNIEVINFLKKYIQENLTDIFGGLI